MPYWPLLNKDLLLFLSGGGAELLGAEFQTLGSSKKSLGLDTARLPASPGFYSGLWAFPRFALSSRGITSDLGSNHGSAFSNQLECGG